MKHQSKAVTFHLTCGDPRAYLVVQSKDRRPLVVEMQCGPGFWSARVDLKEGEHRCRYYCGDDRRIVYSGPARVEGSIDDGLDAIVSIRIPSPDASRRVAFCSIEGPSCAVSDPRGATASDPYMSQ